MKLPYLQSEKRKCRFVDDQELNRSQAFAKVFYDLELIDETYNQNVTNFEELSLLLEIISSIISLLPKTVRQFLALVTPV